jgi:hypothetical protein
MSSPRIEHVNITVSDPERTSGLMEALFDWHVRWSGPAQNGSYDSLKDPMRSSDAR